MKLRKMWAFLTSFEDYNKGERPWFLVGSESEFSKPSPTICRIDSPKLGLFIFTSDELRDFAYKVWDEGIISSDATIIDVQFKDWWQEFMKEVEE